ncbi:MAG: transporter substrate-binding domain-containing protein [Desulfobacter sp.]|nr:MAG: transporter substrate-binding domain-containing protein [Desulfobacter sp.]
MITFAFSEWQPVFHIDENKEMQGLYPEILAELFEKRLGITVVGVDLPWVRSQMNIKNGQSDFSLMVPNEERLAYTEMSKEPVCQLFMNVFTYKGHPKLEAIRKITSARDIKRLGLRPATNIGNGWHKKNIDAYGIHTDYLPDDRLIFRYLAKKRADIVIDILVPSLYHIRKETLQSQIEVTDARFGPLNIHLMMGKKSKYRHLMPRIDQAIAEMKRQGVIQKLMAKFEGAR